MGSKITKNTKKNWSSLQVTGGQIVVKGHTESERRADYSGATPNPNRHFYLKLLTKNSFLTPRWPLITWPSQMKIFFSPIHILSQNIKCVGHCHWELLLFKEFAIFVNIWPPVTSTGTKNNRAHLRNNMHLPTKFDSTMTFPSWVIAYQRSVTHTHTHTHTYKAFTCGTQEFYQQMWDSHFLSHNCW